jgi:negative regulator of flagellin synthesis FlgM
MKIDSVGVSKLLSKYNNQNEKKNNLRQTESASKKDSFNISKDAQELQKAKAKIDDMSKSRQEKVAKLKQDVQQGNYDVVAGEEIAEKMLNQAGINKLV